MIKELNKCAVTWELSCLKIYTPKEHYLFFPHCCMSGQTRISLLENIISIILDCLLNAGLFCKDDWYIYMHESFHYLSFYKNTNKLCFFCYLAKEINLTFCSMVSSLLFWERSVFFISKESHPERCRLITFWWSFNMIITCPRYFIKFIVWQVVKIPKNEKISHKWAYIFMDIPLKALILAVIPQLQLIQTCKSPDNISLPAYQLLKRLL